MTGLRQRRLRRHRWRRGIPSGAPLIGEAVPGKTPAFGYALVQLSSADNDAVRIRNMVSTVETNYKGSEVESGQVNTDLAGDQGAARTVFDQFSGGLDSTQSSSGRLPDYNHNGADNGLPSLDYESAAFDAHDSAGVGGVAFTGLTVFIVTKLVAFPAAGRIFTLQGADAANSLRIISGASNTYRVTRTAGSNNLDFSVVDAALASNHLSQFRFGAGSADADINNGAATGSDTYDDLNTITTTGLSINAEVNDTSPNDQQWQLTMGYTEKLSTAECALVRAAITAQFGPF